MKNTILAVALVASASSLFAGEVIKRGAAIKVDAKAIPLTEILAKPAEYTTEAVVVEGHVEQSCTRKGCWIQVAAKEGEAPVRVTFKDYAFFVPLDSKGMDARMEGVTQVKTLSKADADHLAEEGAKLQRNADGTANEVSFIANGVELRKK
jgi:hypothetical protein